MICYATEYVVKNKLELTVYLTQKSDGHAKVLWYVADTDAKIQG